MDNWEFELTDNTSGSPVVTVIDTPQGWPESVIKIQRNKQWHGIFFDYTFDSLKFEDDAYEILKAAYDLKAIQADVTVKITWDCDNRQMLYTGRFEFRKYKDHCGFEDSCYITIPIESTGAKMKFNNRYDQKVDLDTLEDFAGGELDAYDGLGMEIDLPAKGILLTDKTGTNQDLTVLNLASLTGYPVGQANYPFSTDFIQEHPFFQTESTTAFVPNGNFGSGGPQVFPIFQKQGTTIADFQIDLRLKGTIQITTPSGFTVNTDLKLKVVTVLGAADPDTNAETVLTSQTLAVAGPTYIPGILYFNYDLSYSGTLTMNQIQSIWIYFDFDLNVGGAGTDCYILEDEQASFFKISALKLPAPPTPCKVYLINEVWSRIAEAITDNEMRCKSDYYGRTDSEPYTSDSDGCGSLRCLTGGLLIRRALLGDDHEPVMSLSMKEMFENLNAIDCIGLGIELDTDRGTGMPPVYLFERLRVEKFDFFYNNSVIMTCPSVNELDVEVFEEGYISVYKFGYEKYETEEYNSLDEFLTKREYRAAICESKNTLDQVCNFVASGYAFEITRLKGPDTKDWRYDNDKFILCLERQYASFIVEQGNIDIPTDIIDPPTVYNYRISPMKNALRWLKILMTDFKILNVTNSAFYFTSGTGNYFAQGVVVGGCVIERADVSFPENAVLNYAIPDDIADMTPLWINERVKFRYSLTVYEHNLIKANPYGKIGYSFAGGDLKYGWIDSIEYHAVEGVADFVLIPERI